MSVEVTLDASTVRPIGGIGLPSLNNILVNACLNKRMYEIARGVGGGRELTPRRCGSMRRAAYLFKPEVNVTAQAKELTVRRGSRIVGSSDGGGERKGGADVVEKLDPEDLLPGATEEQSVPYWLNCETESSLTEHFQPNRIVDVMRPADSGSDRLGLLKRLRVRSATFSSLQSELQAGRLQELADDAAASALEVEAGRLRDLLQQVRRKVLQQIDSDDRIALEDHELLDRAEQDDGAYGVFDKKAVKQRIEAVLAAGQSQEESRG